MAWISPFEKQINMKPLDFIDSKADWADVMPMFDGVPIYDMDCPPLDFDVLGAPVTRFKGRVLRPRLSSLDPIDPDILEFMLSLNPLIQMDSSILGGMPVFNGTKVPIKHMFDYLLAGKTIDEFVQRFPEISRSNAYGVLNTEATLFYETISKALDSAKNQ